MFVLCRDLKKFFPYINLMLLLYLSNPQGLFTQLFFKLVDVLDEIWDLIESVSEGFLTSV